MNLSSIFVESNSHLMDIQTKKLKLIEDFLSISDEKLLDKLDYLIRKEKREGYSEKLKPLSLNEFHEMVNEAIEDYEKGNTILQEDLEKEVLTWK
ncbi:MAG: hypothetical protein NTY32_12270 [Bacteroidia bacterium]|nr:hypothetical protein [Bacteroidia bacterium]